MVVNSTPHQRTALPTKHQGNHKQHCLSFLIHHPCWLCCHGDSNLLPLAALPAPLSSNLVLLLPCCCLPQLLLLAAVLLPAPQPSQQPIIHLLPFITCISLEINSNTHNSFLSPYITISRNWMQSRCKHAWLKLLENIKEHPNCFAPPISLEKVRYVWLY